MNYFSLVAELIRDRSEVEGLGLPDAAREFLRENTSHAQGAWWAAHGNDYGYIAEQVYKTAIGAPSAEAVQLLCGNMVNLFSGVCGALGLESRSIWVYSDSQGFFQGHTFLEVYNPSSGKWEIQDADYNVYYLDIRSGERVGVKDMMLASDVDHFIPQNSSMTGWSETGAEGLRLANLFSAQMVTSEHKLYVSNENLTPTLLDNIANSLNGVFSYSVEGGSDSSQTRHLTDIDAIVTGARATINGNDADDFISYDGAYGRPISASLAGMAGDDMLALRWSAGQLYGNEGNDVLIGSIYGDLLVGGAGSDYLSGGGGADQYVLQRNDGFSDVIDSFGVGADKLVMIGVAGTGGAGRVQLSESEFNFRVDQEIADDGVHLRYDINGDARMDGQVLIEGRTSLVSACDVVFVFNADPMSGITAAAVESPAGSSYAEKIYGRAGNDQIIYTGALGAELAGSTTGMNSGNDAIQSHSSANSALYGHDGNDILAGGLGSDYICGGTGDDYLIGRAGYDAFVFTTGSGSDWIDDFTRGEDQLVVYGASGQSNFGDSVSQTWRGDDLFVTFDSTGDGVSDGSVMLIGQLSLLTTNDWTFI